MCLLFVFIVISNLHDDSIWTPQTTRAQQSHTQYHRCETEMTRVDAWHPTYDVSYQHWNLGRY